MSRRPLRFLVLTIGLWVCARAAILAPAWWPGQSAPPSPPSGATAPIPAGATRPNAARRHAVTAIDEESAATGIEDESAASLQGGEPSLARLIRQLSYKTEAGHNASFAAGPGGIAGASGASLAAGAPHAPGVGDIAAGGDTASGRGGRAALVRAPAAGLVPAPALASPSRRWSVSAWMLVRRDRGGSALAPGGTLGGSQAGARISYQLSGGLALSARASLPLRRAAAAEAAAGLDWRPVASLPLNILAERRQALGGEGRSAFALTLYGGGGLKLPHGLRLDGYGQAGMVGTKARDLFVDGAVRVSAPVGPLEVGVGARGAAQPGAARLDAGPGLAWRLPLRGAAVRIEADWRFRIAGAAAPGSGPALTLVTEF